MPFIDIFSMLNTFLLFSAVFLSVGIIEVQVPFLSSAPADPTDNVRSLAVKVDVLPDKIQLVTSYSAPPTDEVVREFALDKNGYEELHAAAVEVRAANEDIKMLTLFSDDAVTFDQLVMILDAVKNRRDTDPEFFETDKKSGDRYRSVHVFSQVVMGSVIL